MDMKTNGKTEESASIRPEAVFRIRGRSVFWGPGLQELLVRIKSTGSVRMAAGEMYMSYAKARRLIALAEEELGFEIVQARKGGLNGGGSVLTEKGSRYLEVCRKVQDEVQQYCEERFTEYMDK